MSEQESSEAAGGSGAVARLELEAAERRVLGVLIEKALTTPEYYPMTLNAIVAGCNQKNNRDPVTHYDEEQVDRALQSLLRKGLVTCAMPWSGRATRWRQDLGNNYKLSAHEVAVAGELLLRGPQSVGDLRGRASRMRPIADLAALDEILAKLRQHAPPLVIRLSPEGVVRGARWTHALYPEAELAKVLAAEPADFADGEPSRAAEPPARAGFDAPALAARIAALEERVSRLEQELGLG